MNAPRAMNVLSGADKFNLQLLVKEEYAKMGLHDKEFAAWASEKLGLTVTSGNVQGARECFGIMVRDVVRPAPSDVSHNDRPRPAHAARARSGLLRLPESVVNVA